MNLAAIIAMMCGQAWMLDERYVLALSQAIAAEQTGAVDGTDRGPARSGAPRMGAPVSLSGGKGSASGAFSRVGSVGVVDVWGVLMKSPEDVRDAWGRFGTSYAEIRQGVAEAAADKDVKTILLRIDSPGGAAIPAETAAAEILAIARSESGKPVVALADGMMASAAFYLGTQATAVYSTPSAWIGSIGTRMDVMNIKGYLDKWGVKVETIKSTWAKDIGSPYKDLGEKERAVLQAEIDAFDRQFVAAVMRGRGVDAATVGQWQSIRGKIGQHAVDAGMADAVVNSAEALVMMLNAAPERVVGVGIGRSRMGAGKVGAGVGVVVLGGAGGTNDGTDNQAGAGVAAAASAGEPAEGNVAARLLGIAGMAAGLALLEPDAGTGGGGGGGTAVAPAGAGGAGVSQAERDRIAAEASQAALKAERDRVSGIRAAAVPFAGNENIVKLSQKAIDEGYTVERFNAEAMKSLAPRPLGGDPAAGGATGSPSVAAGDSPSDHKGGAIAMGLVMRHRPDLAQALRSGLDAPAGSERAVVAREIASHWGFDSAAEAVKALATARSNGLAGLSLRDLALSCVSQHAAIDMATAMRKYGTNPQELFKAAGRTRSGDFQSAQAGVGSSDFPGLMLNVANKVMMASFAMKATIWSKICAVGTAVDFKTAYMVGVSELGKFAQLPEGAPIPETRPAERKETIAVNKFGNAFALTFEAMVNDDLGAFTSVPAMIGEMAKYIPDDLLIVALKANAYAGPTMGTDSTALFDATHKNIASNGTAFSYDAVRAARLLGRKQVSRGPDAVELDIDLTVLLTPTALSQKAEDINTQQFIPGTTNYGQNNTLRGVFDLAWSNKLGTDTRYWLFTRPGPNSVFEVRFLFGQQTPTVALSNESDLTAMRYEAMVPGVGLAARCWEGAVTDPGA